MHVKNNEIILYHIKYAIPIIVIVVVSHKISPFQHIMQHD